MARKLTRPDRAFADLTPAEQSDVYAILMEGTDPAPKPKFDRANHCRQIGMKGGMATRAKYANASGDARGYYSAIGREGFTVYANTHHDGNRAKAAKAIQKMHDPNRNVRQPGAFRTVKEGRW